MTHLHAPKALFAKLPLNGQGQFFITPHTQWPYQRPKLVSNHLDGWQGHVFTT